MYDEAAKRFVGEWKERGRRRLAALAAELVAEVLARPAVEAIAFVPADRERTRERGHRPAEQLARELAARWQLPVQGFLRRARQVERQRGLSLAERRANVRGAFAAAIPVPVHVCLVDDIYTSGATVAAASSALRRGGARRVDVVTFARAVR